MPINYQVVSISKIYLYIPLYHLFPHSILNSVNLSFIIIHPVNRLCFSSIFLNYYYLNIIINISICFKIPRYSLGIPYFLHHFLNNYWINLRLILVKWVTITYYLLNTSYLFNFFLNHLQINPNLNALNYQAIFQ